MTSMFDRRRQEKAENKLKELVCCPFGISFPSYVEQWRQQSLEYHFSFANIYFNGYIRYTLHVLEWNNRE